MDTQPVLVDGIRLKKNMEVAGEINQELRGMLMDISELSKVVSILGDRLYVLLKDNTPEVLEEREDEKDLRTPLASDIRSNRNCLNLEIRKLHNLINRLEI